MSQKVLVAGTGISGISAAKLLLAQGGEVVLYDGNEKLSEEKLKAKFDEGAKVTIVLGELKKTDLMGVELCVISPGIPLESPFVAVIDEAKIPIWSEIELAYHCSKGKLAAITGTNGKTTTTALTGEIMRKFYKSVFVVGNIGDPYTAHALETTDESVTVAEVSSFQLETIMISIRMCPRSQTSLRTIWTAIRPWSAIFRSKRGSQETRQRKIPAY